MSKISVLLIYSPIMV